RHRPGLLIPPEDPVVRDVAPEEVAPVAEPHGPLRPPAPREEPLDGGQRQAVLGEGRIQHPHRRVGIPLARLPHRVSSPARVRAQVNATGSSSIAPSSAGQSPARLTAAAAGPLDKPHGATPQRATPQWDSPTPGARGGERLPASALPPSELVD